MCPHIFSAFALGLFVIDSLTAAPGSLDPTFGRAGIGRYGFGDYNDQAFAVAYQSDGKVVIAGQSETPTGEFGIARYNSDGTLDSSFGQGGKVVTPAGSSAFVNSQAAATGVAIQADSKIVVGGWFFDGIQSNFVACRFNSDGTLDAAFGTGGKVTIDVSAGFNDECYAIALQPDGKIVLAGWSYVSGSFGNVTVVRLLTNGTLDSSFDGDGIATMDLSTGGDVGKAVTIQPDGKIVVAGYAYNGANLDVAVARFNANGSPDAGFNGTGFVMTPVGSSDDVANGVAIQPNNGTIMNPDKIVVVGYTETSSTQADVLVMRYNLNGTLDTGFDGDGIATTDFGSYDVATAVRVIGTFGNPSPPRKIVIVGTTGGSSGHSAGNLIAARYLATGALDTTFDSDGKVTTVLPFGTGQLAAMLLQPDGKLVAAGYYAGAGSAMADSLVGRYNTDGSLDATFAGSGLTFSDNSSNLRGVAASGVAIQPDGKILAGGRRDFPKNQFVTTGDFAVMRFNSDGTFDNGFGTNGRATFHFDDNSGGTGLALQSDGKIVLSATFGNNIGFARINTNGSFDNSFATPVPGASFSVANAVVIQPDGKVVVGGYASLSNDLDFALARFNSNGTTDGTFDGDGIVTTSLGTNQDLVSALAMQTDGKIVAAGTAGNTVAVARYNPDGSLDNSFSFDGKVTTPLGTSGTQVGAVAIQTDGRIVVAASTNNSGDQDFALVRYNTDGSLDTGFDGDGIAYTSVAINDYARAIALEKSGKILLGGSANGDFVVIRYNSNGSVDTSYGTNGITIVDLGGGGFGTDVPYAMTIDMLGRAVVAGASNSLFGLVRLQGDPFLRITSIQKSGNDINLTGLGVPGIANTLEARLDMSTGTFGFLATVTPDANGIWNYPDVNALNLTKRFYRLSYP
jgi:uncharacterized delta-60 repeat protein